MSGVVDVSVRDPRKLTLAERLYLPEILKGMAVTMRHFLRNVVRIRRLPTILYPEQKRDYSDRFRGKHILTTREDGTLKCVACYMCAQACPAECITIVAGEHPKLAYEKYPVVFDIDMLRCVYCGFCVDACPKDAIWMTGDYEMAFFNRQEAVFGIDKLAAKPGLPVKDGLGYRPYYPGDGTVPPTDAAAAPVPPGDGERFRLREEGFPVVPRPSAPQLEPEVKSPAPDAAKAVGVLLLAASLLAGCATRQKGRSVSVTRVREQVAPCTFLGRVTSHELGEAETVEPAPSGPSQFAMQQEAAGMGADTLYVLPNGLAGEAYRCGERTMLVDEGRDRRRPTQAGIPVATTPTPSGVWPAGSR